LDAVAQLHRSDRGKSASMEANARRFLTWGGLLGVLLLGGAVGIAFWWQNEAPLGPADVPGAAPGVTAFFQDVTPASGLEFSHKNGEEADHFTILESLGGGVALFDYDGDGLLDVFLTGGGYFGGPDNKEVLGYACKLYRNLGNWKFQDVTAQAGLDRPWSYNHGCAVADYDCDGWPDLLVTGYERVALFHNESDGHGGRRFVEVTQEAGLDARLWGTSAAWADLDGDGYPDLYLCQYVNWHWKTHQECQGDRPTVPHDVCPPEMFGGLPHRLFHNNRDGTFTDVTQEAGLKAECGKGLGVVIVDVNDDRRPDLYAVNDTVRNYLYVNESSAGRLRLAEMGVAGGVGMGDRGQADGSMGVDAADYDDCGRPSLVVTTFEGELPALYHNECAGDRILFRYATRSAGLAAQGSGYVGFGTAFLDVDLDGWEDLVMVNGHVRRFPTKCGLEQKSLLYRNQGTGQFTDVTVQGGAYFDVLHRGRGLAVGDLDNDGRPDLVISHMNAPVVLLRNAPEGKTLPPCHWLGIDLQGRNHRDVTGAKVVVAIGDRRLTRFTKGGGSYLSSSDRRLLFGIAAADHIDGVTVSWPWGQEQHWNGLPVDRYWRLHEGEARAEEPPSAPGAP
jgi:hypothetical protein